MTGLLASALLAVAAFTAKWIGPAPETRPDFDMGAAQWISAAPGKGGETKLTFAFDCGALPADKPVEMVHAGVSDHRIEINGKNFHKNMGHVHDPRFACFRDMRPWLRTGRNEISVSVKGRGEKAFIAKITMPDGKVYLTGKDWKSPEGPVETIGRVRDTAFGRELRLRTETVSPAFAKKFTLRGKPVKAVLRATGAGLFEAHLNGKKIGDTVLEPSQTAYDKRILFQTFDLSGCIREGENEIVILVGHGWYDIRSTAVWNFETAHWRDFPRAIAQLDVTYADGSVETVGTDSTWRQVLNPVIYDDLYEGEVIDGRIKAGDPLPGRELFAVEVPGPKGRLEPQLQPGSKVMEEIRAVAVHPLGDGECMIELPVNMVGWIRLPLYGQKSGDVVSFRYDERVGDGFAPAAESQIDGINDKPRSFKLPVRSIDALFRYPASYRFCAKDAAFQCDRYICRGEEGEVYEPRFTFKGFRYVYVRGLRKMPKPEDVTGCFVYTAFKTIGEFKCSDAAFNRLMEMGVRSYKSNFTTGVPTDCPHREKNGWTGDASIASELAQYVFENTAAYRKWIGDIIDSQLPSGEIPGIVPTAGWGFAWGNGPAWDSALSVIPWNLWIYRGDREIIDTVYPALVKYLAYTATKADKDGLVKHGLGDWIPVNRDHMPSVEFTSSCYYHQAQRIAAEMARIKGMAADAERFDVSASRTRAAIRAKFAMPDGVWDNGGQTAQAMALAYGIVEESERTSTERKLVESVERTDFHVDMGLLGTKHVFRALSRAGRTDLAWRMLVNPTSPSMTDWIRKGGTTLWEDWKDGYSRNHIMFGDFVGWAYQYLAGIALAEAKGSTSAITIPVETSFRRVTIAPVFLKELDHLSASTETAGGRLGVSWERNGAYISLTVTVPDGTEADIRLPGAPQTEKRGAGTWKYKVPDPGVVDGPDLPDAPYSFTRRRLFPGFDGKLCKIQPTIATDGKGTALLAYQKLLLTGMDVFYGQFMSKSSDGGETWSDPVEQTALKDTMEDGFRVARYATVRYSPKNSRWFALGVAQLYRENSRPFQKFVDGRPYCTPIYVTVDAAKGGFTGYGPLVFPLPHEMAMPFGQHLECDNGELIVPFYYRPVGAGHKGRVVTVRYAFDGEGLRVVKVGTPVVRDDLRRGLGEPSLIRLDGRVYLTLRSDELGLWCESGDGLGFSDPVPWTWTDGMKIGNSNTQQHWVGCGKGLFLAYTRKDAMNAHVFRNRAPVFMARFDPVRKGLVRSTERILVPELGARLGNFCVADDSAGAWLVTAEWMQPRGCERYGSDNSIWLVKIMSGGMRTDR